MVFDLIRRIVGDAGTPRQAALPDERVRLAAAVILLEAAGADDDCADGEIAHVVDTLKEQFGVSTELAAELLDLARAERDRAVDLFRFTRALNEHLGRQEKMALMEAVWTIIYADGRLDRFEDHFAHKLAGLLRLSNREKIDAKLKAKNRGGRGAD